MDKIDLTDIRGKPKVYKCIEIYPVKIKDCEEFYKNLYTLQFDKNSIPDVQIIRMSYLTFLYNLQLTQDEEGNLLYPTLIMDLINLLELILHKKVEEDFYLDLNEKGNMHLVIKTNEGELRFKNKDFDKLRKIIFKQNVIPYDDEVLAPELKKAIQDAREFIYQQNKDKMPTFEEQICCYHCAFHMPYDEIDNLTLYQFTKGLERKGLIYSYQVYGTAVATGMVSGKIPNWLSHIPERGMYDDVLIDEKGIQETTSKVK